MTVVNQSALALVPELDPFERILSRLRAVSCKYRPRSADSVRAQCPAHADAKPSLLVTRLENRVVVKCFAGCQKSHVLRALELGYADLYYGRRTPPAKPQIIATYPYLDVMGNLLAEKVRTDRKQFKWRTPDGLGGWRWSLHGQTITLYGLPDLVDARQVLKPEGEKAVNRLKSLGFAATCGPAGAAQWLDEYAHLLWRLGCAELIVLPDADQAGRRHAQQVAQSCYGLTAATQSDLAERDEPWASWPSARVTDSDVAPLRVKVVELPDLLAGADVHDFLQRHSADDLRELTAKAPYWYPGIDDEQRLARRRELTRARVRRKRARDRADQQPCNAANIRESVDSVAMTTCNAPYVRNHVTRNAVTHTERSSIYITKDFNKEKTNAA